VCIVLTWRQRTFYSKSKSEQAACTLENKDAASPLTEEDKAYIKQVEDEYRRTKIVDELGEYID
jgi:hypothetical protein